MAVAGSTAQLRDMAPAETADLVPVAALASVPAVAFVAHAAVPPAEVEAWSESLARHAPDDAEMHAWFAGEIARLAPGRDDIRTYFDLLDLDDYVSFGGRG